MYRNDSPIFYFKAEDFHSQEGTGLGHQTTSGQVLPERLGHPQPQLLKLLYFMWTDVKQFYFYLLA